MTDKSSKEEIRKEIRTAILRCINANQEISSAISWVRKKTDDKVIICEPLSCQLQIYEGIEDIAQAFGIGLSRESIHIDGKIIGYGFYFKYNGVKVFQPTYHEEAIMTDNPVHDYEQRSTEQEEALAPLPVCDICHEPIQEESYQCIADTKYCDSCLKDYEVSTNETI